MRHVSRPFRQLALAAAFGTSTGAACGQSTAPDVLGEWGGEHIGLIVSHAGARIEYDCAHGTIDEPLVVTVDGRFDARGSHVRERGGPVREGEPEDRHPARYTGTIRNRVMTLTVTLTDSGTKVGTFTLVHGGAPRVFKCL